MGFLDKLRKKEVSETTTELAAKSNEMTALMEFVIPDVETDLTHAKYLSIPMQELTTMGTAISTLVPQFRTITSTSTVNMGNLYRLANQFTGDILKQAKDGNFWASLKKAEGGSKMVKLQVADPLDVANKVVAPINPALLFMAATLYSMNKKLDEISQTQKRILSFLETEKESMIIADLKMLESTLREYPYNWDKDIFISGHYQLALNVKHNAEKNLQSYQKELSNMKNKSLITTNANTATYFNELIQKLKYYKLSVYTYSMSSFVEVLLLGDFREEYLQEMKKNIEDRSHAYREMFAVCSKQVQKMIESTLEGNIMKGLGTAGEAVGEFMGNIPLLKAGPVNDWLKEGGVSLTKTAKDMEKGTIEAFASVSNPETHLFVEKLDTLNQIYHETTKICFDQEKIYLVA